MSIARRVVVDSTQFAVAVDRHTTSWDAIAIPGHTTTITSSLALRGYDGLPVDLYGQPRSCNIKIVWE